MKKKLQFLLSLVTLMCFGITAYAQTDCTAKVGTSKDSWNGTGTYGSVQTFAGTTTPLVEFYGSSDAGTKLSQAITGLDKGIYEVTVFATSHNAWGNHSATLQADADDVAYIFATAGGTTLKEFFTAHKNSGMSADEPYKITISNITVPNGNLTIGLALDKSGQTEWQTIQIYQLTRTGDIPLSKLVTSYEQAFAAAQTTAAKTDKASSETRNALNLAIESNANIDKESEDALIAAINALSTAKDNVEASIVAYAPLTAIINEGEVIKANVDATAADAYATAIADVLSAYDAGIVEDIPTAIGVVEKALPALAKAQTVPGSDMTRAIVNATIDGDANGWTTEKTVNGNGPMYGTTAFEYWSYTEGKGGFDYYQEISGLPYGFYTISAEMFNDQVAPAGNTFAPAAGVYGTAGQETVFALVTTQGATPTRYTTEKIAVTDGKLRIGIKNYNADGNMPARWFYADNFQLTYVEKFINYDGFDYAAAGENLFANGSFDDGVTGWKTIGYTTDAVASNFTITATGGFDDGAYITTNGAGVGSEKTIRQSVAVEAGKTYYFTVYTSGKAPDANNFNYNALFKMSDATTEDGVLKAFEWPQGAAQISSTWSQTEFVFTADESHPYVGVRMGWNQNSNFDGFALFEVKPVAIPIATLIERAQNLLDDPAYALITGEERTALSTAIVENANPGSSSEEYQAAADAITNASDAFKAALSSYESLATVKAIVDLEAWPYASAEKKTAVEALLVDPSNATDATEKAAALTTAYRQFVESNALAEGVEGAVDMTSLIVNPTAEEAIADPWKVVLGEGSGGALDVKNGEPWTDGSGSTAHKYFDGGNWGATAWDVSLTQDITLKPGKYMLTAIARASGDVAFSLFAGETKATIPSIGAAGGVFNRGWNDQFVEFEVTEAGTVTIGVQGVTSKQYNWMSMSNFRLVQLEATGGEEPVIADLTQAMFFDWDGVDAEAQKTSDTPTGCDYKLNTSTDMVYGTSTVTHTKYADLSEWDYLTIAAPQGTPRLQFNRKTADGQDHVKIPDNAEDVEKYIKKSEDGTFVYNLAAIKAVWGFVHLNAIKTSGGPGIIQEMKLSTVKPYEPTWYTISVAEGIENGTVEATLTKSVAGAPVSVTATPAEGFEHKAIKYTAEGEEPTTQEGTTFTMPAANVTVSATFTKAPEYIVSDLTKAMFHDWSSADGTAEIITEEAACDYAIGDVEAKAQGTALYGNGNVLGQSFADLSEYKSLALDVESGAIRIMLNTVGQEDPKTYIELNQGSNKSYFSINNKTWTIDLDKFKQVENVEYVHLNVIKVAWGSSAAISAAKLTKLAEETPTLYTITIAETENGTVETDVAEAEEGATVTVTVTPNDGFMVDEVSLTYGEGQKVEFDGEPTENEGVLSATFTMPAGNVNVGFTFKKVEYDITVAGATPSEEPGAYLVEGGKISISSDAFEGEQVTLSLGPDEGYEVESVSVTKTADGSEVQLIQDPEHQTNWTFIMPGEAVTVTAAFKKTSVEPTPTIAATLVHTASASWGANKTGDGNKPNTVDSEAEYYNNDATSTGDKNWNGAAYAEFETNLPNGVAITKATLTWQTVTAGRVNTERSNIVYYLNAGTQIDYEALAAYKEMTDVLLYEDARTQIKDYKGQNTFDGELDVTEAVQAIVAAKQNYIIFQWTGNNASATLAGKASANAPKLVIEYSDPEIEVDGIVYALKGENLFVNGSFDEGVAGWKTVGYTTDAVATNFTLSDEGGFDNGAFITTNGGGVGSENTIRQSVAVEPGKMYYFTVYTSGKAPDANNFNYNALFQMSDATTENGVLKAFEWPQGAAQTTTEWSQTEFVFTATEDNPFVGVRMGWNQNSSFDGFALYEVKQLSTALEAAQAKAITALNALAPVGDGIFMYAQTDIDAAKAAVAAATTVAEVEAVEMPTMTAPDANQQYILSLTTSEGTFPLSVATSGITIAEEGTPVTFVAQEGGTYALSNGTEYLNYKPDGNKWDLAATTDAYGWTIAALPDGGYSITGKNGLFGTNTKDGNAVNSPCYGDKNTGNGNYIWTIAEYVEPTEKTIEIAFERMVNKGYTADEVSYTESEEEILEFLGVATWEDIETMYPVVMTTGVAGTDNDGWRDVNGDPAAWSGEGTGLGLCLKYPHDGSFALCTHPGNEPAEGAVLSAAWALSANGKTMTVKVNVTFIEYVEPEYKPEIAKTIEIEGIDLAGAAYAQNNLGEGMNRPAIKFDVNEICEALGVEDITTLKSYIVNVTTGNFVENTTDGWRNAQGDAAGWDIADNGYCLKMNAPASGEFDYAAAHDDNFAEGNTYVAQWGLVKEGGEGATDQAVVLKVTITFVSEEEWNAAVDTATGIDGIASEGKAKANGKYLENGKVVIYRNGQKFSTTGVQLK